MKVCGKNINVRGRFIRIAQIDGDKYNLPDDPEVLIDGLRKCGERIDLFTFMQKLPETNAEICLPHGVGQSGRPAGFYVRSLVEPSNPVFSPESRAAGREERELCCARCCAMKRSSAAFARSTMKRRFVREDAFLITG